MTRLLSFCCLVLVFLAPGPGYSSEFSLFEKLSNSRVLGKVPCNPSSGKICKDEIPVFWAAELVSADLAVEMLDLFWKEEPNLFPLPAKPIHIAVVDAGFNEEMSNRFARSPVIKLGQYNIQGELRKAMTEGKKSPEKFIELMDEIILRRFSEDRRGWQGEIIHTHRSDPSGHGTMVSGLVAGKGGFGIARDVQLDVYGVQNYVQMGAFGAIPSTAVDVEPGWLPAIYEACRAGVRVINFSVGYEDPEHELKFAETNSPLLDYLYKKGCLLIKAAGNESARGQLAHQKRVDHPALLTVAGVQINGNASAFSNAGMLTGPASKVGVLRPINLKNVRPELLCKGGKCLQIDGTSFATPITTGIAGLVLEVLQRTKRYDDLSPQEQVDILKTILKATNQNQKGEIDAARAVRVAIHWGHTGKLLGEFPELREFCRSHFQCMRRGIKCSDFRDCVRDLRFQVSLCSEDRAQRLENLGDIYLAANRREEAARWYNQALGIKGKGPSVRVVKAAWELEEKLWKKWKNEENGDLNPSLKRSLKHLTVLWSQPGDSKTAIAQFNLIHWSPYFRHVVTSPEIGGSTHVQRLTSELFEKLVQKVGFDEAFDAVADQIKQTSDSEVQSKLYWERSVAIFLLLSLIEKDKKNPKLSQEQKQRLIAQVDELAEFFFNSEVAETYPWSVDKARRPWNALMKSPLSGSVEVIDSALESGDISSFPTNLFSFAIQEGRSHFGEDRVRRLEVLAIREIAGNSEAFNGFSGRLTGEMVRESEDAHSHLLALFQSYLDGMGESYSWPKVSNLSYFIKILSKLKLTSAQSNKVAGALKVALAQQILAGGASELSDHAGETGSIFGSGFARVGKALTTFRVGDEYESKIDYLALARLALEALHITPTFIIRGHSDYIKGEGRKRRKNVREYALVTILQSCLFYYPNRRLSSEIKQRPSVSDEALVQVRKAVQQELDFDRKRPRRKRLYRFSESTREGLKALLKDPISAKDLQLNEYPM